MDTAHSVGRDRSTERETCSYYVSSSDVNNKTCKQYETNAKQNETANKPHQTHNLELEAIAAAAAAAKKYKIDEKNTQSIMNEACRSQFIVYTLSVWVLCMRLY